MAKVNKRAKARAEKKARKAARYAARHDPKENNSPYAERFRARLRGAGMNLRTHEAKPWWEFSVSGWPLSKVMAAMPVPVPREMAKAA